MISAWHLLWIVPVAVAIGMGIAALMEAGRSGENEDR